MKALSKLAAFFMVIVPLAWAVQAAAAATTLSYEDLVKRYLDLEGLAVLPGPGETGAMWSSYDRASKYDAAEEKYVAWSANGDGQGSIRKEGEQIVMAEMDGPGCIWRIWSAHAGAGHVKIYLDGNAEPALDFSFGDYFDPAKAPFPYKSLAYTASAGRNLYVPIPFKKSCKILADPKWGNYFHFTYSTFPETTTLPTFSLDMPGLDAALKDLNDFFANRLGTDPAGQRKDEKTVEQAVQVSAGKSKVLAKIEGPRAITAIKCKMDFADRKEANVTLRELVLKITWDGQQKPAVWCPLGDFFGTAPGPNQYRSLPLGITKDGFYCYWYMPFARSAVVELVNDGKAARKAQFSITHAPLTRPFKELGHFRAVWHRDLAPVRKDRSPDWTVLQTKGRGRFCGMMLHVWNPVGGWWGEGDEKFHVDGEPFPSTFGTGTEDYFGYAWCNPGWFERPFHGQTMTENNAGNQSVYRWQIADNVPFHTSFDGYLEKYYPNENPTLFACTVVWYRSPDGADALEPVPVAERHEYFKWPPDDIAGFKVLDYTRGIVRPQAMGSFPSHKWKDGDQFWWINARPGDKLVLALPVEKTGTYQLEVTLTKAKDYGIFQLYLDEKKVGEQVDLYDPAVIPTGPIQLGTHELKKGDHTLTVEIVGANEKAIKAYMFGLDEVRLIPK